jgi:hypothetical protein
MYKLTVECKDIKSLSEVVSKLGGEATSAKVEVGHESMPELPKADSTSKVKTKADLKAEAESMGIEITSRDTKADIEAKIKAHASGASHPQQPVAEQAPQNTVPDFGGQPVNTSIPNAQSAGNANPFPQAETAAQVNVQATTPAFNREAALEDILGRLQMCADKGIPEAQIHPAIQAELQAVGAPINKRLSHLEDAHLSNAHPRILAVLDAKLQASQSSSFV